MILTYIRSGTCKEIKNEAKQETDLMLDKLLTQCQKKNKYPAKLGNFPVFKLGIRHDNILLPLGTN